MSAIEFEDISHVPALLRGTVNGRRMVLMGIVAEAAGMARRPLWMPKPWTTRQTSIDLMVGVKA